MRASIGAGRFAELDLDQLVRVERDIERSDEPFGEAVLAHLHHRLLVVSKSAQKAPLLAVQHRVHIARMDAIDVRALDFAYADGPPVLRGLTLAVPTGARCLLVGANGSGKTTLLSLVAGQAPGRPTRRCACSGGRRSATPRWCTTSRSSAGSFRSTSI